MVATNDMEEKRLMDLWSRATQNNVPGLQLVDHDGIKEREPACEVNITNDDDDVIDDDIVRV